MNKVEKKICKKVEKITDKLELLQWEIREYLEEHNQVDINLIKAFDSLVEAQKYIKMGEDAE